MAEVCALIISSILASFSSLLKPSNSSASWFRLEPECIWVGNFCPEVEPLLISVDGQPVIGDDTQTPPFDFLLRPLMAWSVTFSGYARAPGACAVRRRRRSACPVREVGKPMPLRTRRGSAGLIGANVSPSPGLPDSGEGTSPLTRWSRTVRRVQHQCRPTGPCLSPPRATGRSGRRPGR